MAGAGEFRAPKVKLSYQVAQVLVKCGYLAGVELDNDEMIVKLKYAGKIPAIMGIKRVSKPGGRIYAGVDDLPKVWGGLGTNVLSTPKGVVDSKEAKKLKSGGEILVQVW